LKYEWKKIVYSGILAIRRNTPAIKTKIPKKPKTPENTFSTLVLVAVK